MSLQAAQGRSDGGRAANLLTVRLSSGISANILDFRVPQKHVLTGQARGETDRKAGGGEVRIY
jgi:hypothetical protein